MRHVHRAEPLSAAIGDLAEAEIDAVVALWRACGLTRPWNDPFADARLALANESSTILALRERAALLAAAMVGVDGHRGYVYYLAVDPAARRRGLGRAIMRACEDWIVARGHPKLHLFVRADNAAVLAFYNTLGYQIEETHLLGKRFDGRQRS